MAGLPYMPLYVDDFEADTPHLTLEEDGAYNRLLRLCWRTSGCSLPNDPKWIARRMRVSIDTYHALVEPLLKEFFTVENGRVFQKRQREEWRKANSTSKKRAESGRKGGMARKSMETKETGESPATDLLKPGSSIQYQYQNHSQNHNTGTLEGEILSLIGLEPGRVSASSPWAYLSESVKRWREEFCLEDADILNVVRMVAGRKVSRGKELTPSYFDGPMHDHAMRKAGIMVPFRKAT